MVVSIKYACTQIQPKNKKLLKTKSITFNIRQKKKQKKFHDVRIYNVLYMYFSIFIAIIKVISTNNICQVFILHTTNQKKKEKVKSQNLII